MLPHTALHSPTSHPAGPPSMRRRRRVPSRLDPVTLAALREMLAPPAESEADAERAVAAIMARVHTAFDVPFDATVEASAGAR